MRTIDYHTKRECLNNLVTNNHYHKKDIFIATTLILYLPFFMIVPNKPPLFKRLKGAYTHSNFKQRGEGDGSC